MKARWTGPDRIEWLGKIREFGEVYDFASKDAENLRGLVEPVEEPKLVKSEEGEE